MLTWDYFAVLAGTLGLVAVLFWWQHRKLRIHAQANPMSDVDAQAVFARIARLPNGPFKQAQRHRTQALADWRKAAGDERFFLRVAVACLTLSSLFLILWFVT